MYQLDQVTGRPGIWLNIALADCEIPEYGEAEKRNHRLCVKIYTTLADPWTVHAWGWIKAIWTKTWITANCKGAIELDQINCFLKQEHQYSWRNTRESKASPQSTIDRKQSKITEYMKWQKNVTYFHWKQTNKTIPNSC